MKSSKVHIDISNKDQVGKFVEYGFETVLKRSPDNRSMTSYVRWIMKESITPEDFLVIIYNAAHNLSGLEPVAHEDVEEDDKVLFFRDGV